MCTLEAGALTSSVHHGSLVTPGRYTPLRGTTRGYTCPSTCVAAAPYGGTRGRTRGGTHCGGNGGKNAGLCGCTRRGTHDVSFAETHGRTLGGIIVRNWRVL